MEQKLLDLSRSENELVQKAYRVHRDAFDNAERVISLLDHGFVVKNSSNSWIFMLYLAQACANLKLMFLSTIRKHDIQMLMMARQMLEATPLMCYSLTQQAFANACVGKNAGVVIHEMKACWDKKIIYPWLDKEFGVRSTNIKRLKDKINENYAHTGIFSAQNHLALDMKFFDEQDEEFVSRRLSLCADIALHTISLAAEAVERYPGAIALAPDFIGTFNLLSEATDRLKRPNAVTTMPGGRN
jgi:hypothetical protein